MVSKLFEKKTRVGMCINEEPAQEFHKPVIKKFKRRKLMLDLKIIFRQQI